MTQSFILFLTGFLMSWQLWAIVSGFFYSFSLKLKNNKINTWPSRRKRKMHINYPWAFLALLLKNSHEMADEFNWGVFSFASVAGVIQFTENFRYWCIWAQILGKDLSSRNRQHCRAGVTQISRQKQASLPCIATPSGVLLDCRMYTWTYPSNQAVFNISDTLFQLRTFEVH